MTRERTGDPSQPAWSYVRARPVPRPGVRSAELDPVVEVWRRNDAGVVRTHIPGTAVLHELRATPRTDGTYRLSERDYEARIETVRIGLTQESALHRVTEALAPAEAVADARAWETRAPAGGGWHVEEVGEKAPPSERRVRGWFREEVRELDGPQLARALGAELPETVLALARRAAFHFSSTASTGCSVHVAWGDDLSEVELVVSTQPDAPTADAGITAPSGALRFDGEWRQVFLRATDPNQVEVLADVLAITRLAAVARPVSCPRTRRGARVDASG